MIYKRNIKYDARVHLRMPLRVPIICTSIYVGPYEKVTLKLLFYIYISRSGELKLVFLSTLTLEPVISAKMCICFLFLLFCDQAFLVNRSCLYTSRSVRYGSNQLVLQ